MSERIIPASMQAIYDQWHFAPAVRVGDTLYLSGLMGTEADSSISGEAERQFAQVFSRMEEVLAEAGCGLGDVVEMTSYHLNLAETFSVFSAVKDAHMPAPHPAWTAIGVYSLLLPGALVEVKAVARIPESS
jgi:enamine deaminase RidA (YjgF/YER057c/UK114 family)